MRNGSPAAHVWDHGVLSAEVSVMPHTGELALQLWTNIPITFSKLTNTIPHGSWGTSLQSHHGVRPKDSVYSGSVIRHPYPQSPNEMPNGFLIRVGRVEPDEPMYGHFTGLEDIEVADSDEDSCWSFAICDDEHFTQKECSSNTYGLRMGHRIMGQHWREETQGRLQFLSHPSGTPPAEALDASGCSSAS